MSTPNIAPTFKPNPSDAPLKRGQATTQTSDGKSYKEATDIQDRDGNKYNVKRFMYPYDLDSNPEYGQQMAIFFINVRTAGKSITGSDQKLYKIPDEDVIKFAGQKLATEVGNAVAPVLATAGIGESETAKLVQAARMDRLDTAICLHMPNSVRTNYGVNWGETTDEEMRTKDLIVQSLIKTANATSSGAASENGTANKILSGGTAAVVAAGKAALTAIENKIVTSMGSYEQKSLGVTGGNSKQEQVFQGVAFREFQFAYNFFPKSPDEAENILNIIRLFRYHMLPEFLDSMSFMYIYPSEFNIKYYSLGKENQYLEKLSTCVLKSLDVDYTPSGQFSTFKPTAQGAMPTQINLNMTFMELSKPSKETSDWGGQGL